MASPACSAPDAFSCWENPGSPDILDPFMKSQKQITEQSTQRAMTAAPAAASAAAARSGLEFGIRKFVVS
jgi:hypothetical protein